MRLSKRESKYRVKIIQERHYNKGEQRILDQAAAENGYTYKRIYNAHRRGETYAFMAVIAMTRASKAFAGIGIAASDMAESFGRLAEASGKELLRTDGTEVLV